MFSCPLAWLSTQPLLHGCGLSSTPSVKGAGWAWLRVCIREHFFFLALLWGLRSQFPNQGLNPGHSSESTES